MQQRVVKIGFGGLFGEIIGYKDMDGKGVLSSS